jgi:hypothetical protein
MIARPDRFKTAEDLAVARGYPSWPDKGPIVDGRRLTVMTVRTSYRIGEVLRVVHALEVTEPGHELYVMGPKVVYGEYLDGRLATPPVPDEAEPFIPPIYDGEVVPGPGVDDHYEVTTYRFAEPGVHRVYWQLGAVRSNELAAVIG